MKSRRDEEGVARRGKEEYGAPSRGERRLVHAALVKMSAQPLCGQARQSLREMVAKMLIRRYTRDAVVATTFSRCETPDQDADRREASVTHERRGICRHGERPAKQPRFAHTASDARRPPLFRWPSRQIEA